MLTWQDYGILVVLCGVVKDQESTPKTAMATESMLSMLLAVLLLASGAAAQHEYALLNASYGYIYGPEDNWLDSNSNEKPVTEGNWNELSDSECGEMNQSPIDINTSSLSSIVNSDASPVTSVNFDSDISQNNIQAIKNLGKSVQLDMADDTFTIDRLDGTTQRVIQFHFHWGSEHKINGSRYPMECHFVLSQNSVIGVLFTADSDAAESAADEFISGISAATNANHDSPGNDTGGVLDQLPQRQLFDLFPRTSPAFYYYDGMSKRYKKLSDAYLLIM